MTNSERQLYHQIHPLKLLTDWGTGVISLVLLWRHHLAVSLVVGFLPSIIVTVLIVRLVDLEPYKRSRFGRYIAQHMTRTVEAVRFGGFLIMGLAAWYRIPWLIPCGLLVIVGAWTHGIFAGRHGKSRGEPRT